MIRIIQLSVLAAMMVTLFAFKKSPALEYAFKQGDTYRNTEVTEQSITQDIPGLGEINIQITTEATSTFNIAAITTTGAKLEVQYTAFKMVTKSPQGDITIDANSDDPNAEILKGFLNKSFDVFISKNGAIEKIERTDNLVSGLPSNNPQSDVFKQLLTDDALRTTYQTIFVEYPTKSIKKGFEWKTTQLTENPYPIESKNVITFHGVVDKQNSFVKKSDIKTSDETKTLTISGFNAKTSLAGTSLCESKFSTTTGWPTQVVNTGNLSGKVTILAGGAIPFDMSIPIQIKTKTDYSIEKI